MWHDMWNGHGTGMWPWGLMMGLFWLVLFGLVIFFAVYAVRAWSDGQQTAGGPPGGGEPPERQRETPREILDRRYAEGEISEEEYDQMKRDLSEG